MYPILLTHSSVDGYLSCFHVLAVKNNATVNIRVQVDMCFIFISCGGYLGV
jgi:hypothetical protein